MHLVIVVLLLFVLYLHYYMNVFNLRFFIILFLFIFSSLTHATFTNIRQNVTSTVVKTDHRLRVALMQTVNSVGAGQYTCTNKPLKI